MLKEDKYDTDEVQTNEDSLKVMFKDYPEYLELVLKRIRDEDSEWWLHEEDEKPSLSEAFIWSNTPEGLNFWSHVEYFFEGIEDKLPEIPEASK